MNKITFETLLQTPIQDESGYRQYVRAAYEKWANCKQHNPPQFFAGSIDSEIAVISLNPHAGTLRPNREICYCGYCKTWEDYYHFFSNFPCERYAPEGCASHVIKGVSKFDRELHCFFSGNLNPCHADLAKWKIFHVEISPIETARYVRRQDETENNCYCFLRALEAVSLKDRSLVVLLNRDGCKLIDLMNHKKMLVAKREHDNDLVYSVTLSNGKKQNVKRLDYCITLPNGKTINLVATPTFPLRYVADRLVFLSRYYQEVFTKEEKKLLAAGVSA